MLNKALIGSLFHVKVFYSKIQHSLKRRVKTFILKLFVYVQNVRLSSCWCPSLQKLRQTLRTTTAHDLCLLSLKWQCAVSFFKVAVDTEISAGMNIRETGEEEEEEEENIEETSSPAEEVKYKLPHFHLTTLYFSLAR